MENVKIVSQPHEIRTTEAVDPTRLLHLTRQRAEVAGEAEIGEYTYLNAQIYLFLKSNLRSKIMLDHPKGVVIIIWHY